ncbi:alpha/beta hydrolase [uncultured Nocardioides sp.]|uniref:alpha/beta fold hydrolase n=1 Tax=uncultured Nocardioides sp. TaxID=198441 RepID=UPI002612A9ED|nr:alpha/beta hydrolase [uncultured Nocardioides sp.]
MTTHTVTVPGATLTYDVHGELGPGVVPLVLAGSPMDASGFETLRSHFADRAVVTYDPRNVGRSVPDDRTAAVTPEQHADDLHAVLADVGHGPVDLFGTSGGAVNALHLVARHPDDVRLVVAHEPPAANALPDHAEIVAVCDDMVATYDAQGMGPAMARFIAAVMHRGPVGADYLSGPAPDPAAFGLPTEDDGDRGDGLMGNMRGEGVARGMPDPATLRAASTTVVVAVGEESGGPEDGEIAGRAAYAVAAALGQDAVVFPSGHAGFLGGEYGQTGQPDAFAARLREVLASA